MIALGETALPGVWEVTSPAHQDPRGNFRRAWCRDSFARAGVVFEPVQASLAENVRAGTLRGMHWQAEPHGEGKLVRCVAGAMFDVALDLRPGSPAYLRWHGVHLSAEEGNALLVPPGVAHGYLTLTDGVVISYMMDAVHVPGTGRGVRWDDPAFGIRWPSAPVVIADRDRDWPDFRG